MNSTAILRFLLPVSLMAIVPIQSDAHAVQVLSLQKAEHEAVRLSPELQKLKVESNALENQSIANAQLPDPQLMLGAANVPTHSFSFTQDDMTMVDVGVLQSFPKGRSLPIKSQQTKELAIAEKRKVIAEKALLLRRVRESWLDLYYWIGAQKIVRQNQILFQHLLKSSQSQYSVGKGIQSDVLQIQIEVSKLNDQLIQIQEHIDILRAQMGRFIGQTLATQPLSTQLPFIATPESFQTLHSELLAHPLIQVDNADIKAAHQGIAFAKEQYKPGFTVAVDYALRQGSNMNGTRSDFVGAQVTIDLPIFPHNRQGKQLQVATDQWEASLLDRDAHYKDLLNELTGQYAVFKELSLRNNFYQHHIIPEAIQNAKAALIAYQNTKTDLTSVLRAYSNQLNLQLEALQICIAREKAYSALLYLENK